MRLNIIYGLAAVVVSATPCLAQLNQFAQAAGLRYFGTALDNPGLSNQRYMAIASDRKEFGLITPANGQKWDVTEPSQGQFNFADGDAIVKAANQTGQYIRCHTLVWHSQLPGWVSSSFSRDQMERVIRTHIENVAGHYRGLCYAWDVVNEALDEDGTFRNSPMYQAMGADFIPYSFAVAAEADPRARLYYNDYNIGYAGPKASAAVGIVRSIQAAGARIDGVGEQGHYIVGQTPSKDDLMATMATYAELVREVAYTEVDIRHSSLPASEEAEEQQATDYVTVVDACLSTPKCVGITVWDFADQYSWIPQTFPGQGDACLYDVNLSKKPAYFSVGLHFMSVASVRAATTATSVTTTLANSISTVVTTTANATTVATVTNSTSSPTISTPTISTPVTPTEPSDTTTVVTGPIRFTPTASSEEEVETPTEEAEIVIVTEVYTETVVATELDTVLSTITQFTDPPAAVTTPAPAGPGVSRFQQCGGSNYNGPTSCLDGATCSTANQYYAQCV